MKKKITTFLIAATLIACQHDDKDEFSDCFNSADIAHTSIVVDPYEYSEYTPIEISKNKLHEIISFKDAFDVKEVGKIYLKDNYIFVGEKNEGFHVYDNSDPKNPQQKKYLQIGQTSDIAIREQHLYVNQYSDLVTLKIDLNNFSVEQTGRERDVFNHIDNYRTNISPDNYYFEPKEDRIIIGFTKKENFTRPEFPEVPQARRSSSCFEEHAVDVLSSDSSRGKSADGQGGSFATFALKDNYLYTVDNKNLTSFLIEGEHQKNPVFSATTNVGFGIETLFGFDDNLFIGSNDAMYIYGLEQPETPKLKSISSHFRACDPVIANDTHAFVTIRGGSRCGGSSNQLKIYGIADVENPELILDRELINPKGLTLYKQFLLVADSSVRIFDISKLDTKEISLVDKIDESINDLIIRDNHLFAIGDSGVYQYELSITSENKLEVTPLSSLVF